MNKIILVIKKTIDVGYSALTEIETSPKASNSKVVIELELLSTKVFLARVTLKNGQKEYLWLILIWKLVLGL